MPCVTYQYYTSSYLGSMVSQQDFPTLEAQAERLINAVTNMAVTRITSLPVIQQTLLKDAICAQVDYFGYYGQEVAISGRVADGFTVGKVSVSGGAEVKAQNNALCPMAQTLLEQAGLMLRIVPVASEPFLPFPWG